jgi:hypothetical protein
MNKLLVLSSCFFLIPTYYSFINNEYLLCYFVGSTATSSFLYWLNSHNKFLLKLDLITCRIGGSYWNIHAFIDNKYNKCLYILYFGYMCYFFSNYFYKHNKKIWVYFHFMFHLCCVIFSTIYINKIQL